MTCRSCDPNLRRTTVEELHVPLAWKKPSAQLASAAMRRRAPRKLGPEIMKTDMQIHVYEPCILCRRHTSQHGTCSTKRFEITCFGKHWLPLAAQELVTLL